MKRPNLKRSLAKYQEAAAAAAVGKKKGAPEKAKSSGKTAGKTCATKLVVHQWSDRHRTLVPYRAAAATFGTEPENDGNYDDSADTDAVLVVGDGDLSFSRALLEWLPGPHLISTVFDGSDAAMKKYPQFEANFAALRDASAKVACGVDGTKLSLRLIAGKTSTAAETVPRLARIVFNFPHTGEGIKDRSYNIRAQQELVLAFLHSAADLLSHQAKSRPPQEKLLLRRTLISSFFGPVKSYTQKGRSGNENDSDGEDQQRRTKKRKQGQSQSQSQNQTQPQQHGDGENDAIRQQPEIHLTLWSGDPYDDWNVKKLAASTGKLALLESFAFDASRYTNYRHCRTIGHVPKEDAFLRPARTFVFVLKQ